MMFPRVSAQEAAQIESTLPDEITKMGYHPALALLVTLYILQIGQTIGQEMAATTGFPKFHADQVERLELMRDSGFGDDLAQAAAELIEATESALAAGREAAQSDPALAEQALLAAAILSQGDRTGPQGRKLSKTLSVISENSLARPDEIPQNLAFWEPGVTAIARITRLMIAATLPTRVGTKDHLANPDSGLRLISTLGGALFLGNSIGVLLRQDPESGFAKLGLRIANLTMRMKGQPSPVPNEDAVDRYMREIEGFGRAGDSVFAIEHPFHFRVLLEVMSDENRRYPAEPVLNMAALRHILGHESLWSHVAWSREQLPVVANLLQRPEGKRADAYIQHYAAFGRTPHTSSFTHLDYEIGSPVGDESVSGAWPTAFRRYQGTDLQNMPNSVAQVIGVVARERAQGRLWRGEPADNDLRWLCGQLVMWDGRRELDGALASRIWHSGNWAGQTFPVSTMTEVRVGSWLLETLRRRLETAVPPVAQAGSGAQSGREHHDREYRVNQELRCVLEIMALFADGYLKEDDDGLAGLRESLRRLRDSAVLAELGPAAIAKLEFLESCLAELGAQLDEQVRLARQALSPADSR